MVSEGKAVTSELFIVVSSKLNHDRGNLLDTTFTIPHKVLDQVSGCIISSLQKFRG